MHEHRRMPDGKHARCDAHSADKRYLPWSGHACPLAPCSPAALEEPAPLEPCALSLPPACEHDHESLRSLLRRELPHPDDGMRIRRANDNPHRISKLYAAWRKGVIERRAN